VLDSQLVRTSPDLIRASQRARGEDPGVVDALIVADSVRRAAIGRFETARAEQKELGKEISRAPKDRKAGLLAEGKRKAAEVKDAEAAQLAAEARFVELAAVPSNIVAEGVPSGGEDDYVVLEEVGSPPRPDIATRDHLELGELLGAIDLERGAKVSGSRFYYLTGAGALLELALINLAIARAVAAGFIPMIPPALVRSAAMEGTGFLGQAEDNVYRLPDDDLYLVGTAEVPLAAFHMNEILDADTLPMRYAGYSPCFRREAGSHGRDTRGIWRVHWFDKVEMFCFVDPADAEAEHLRILEWEKEFLSALELPFRVIEVAAGDLGASAARKYDCEAWIPSRGGYGELTSTSNCTQFQARRLGIRMRDDNGVRPLATLNGTLCAVTRTIVALLENHQRPDGSVRVPAALRPFLGRDVLEPVARR
jgi:seryl-tRNA synthetase